jgi:hypothetical protein
MTDATSATTAPTVLFVHGVSADGSSWAGVIQRLQAAGVGVRAIVNPLRGLAADAAYVASAIAQDPRPGAGRRPLLRRRGDHQPRPGWSGRRVGDSRSGGGREHAGTSVPAAVHAAHLPILWP